MPNITNDKLNPGKNTKNMNLLVTEKMPAIDSPTSSLPENVKCIIHLLNMQYNWDK